jgi:hypothetical protein
MATTKVSQSSTHKETSLGTQGSKEGTERGTTTGQELSTMVLVPEEVHLPTATTKDHLQRERFFSKMVQMAVVVLRESFSETTTISDPLRDIPSGTLRTLVISRADKWAADLGVIA